MILMGLMNMIITFELFVVLMNTIHYIVSLFISFNEIFDTHTPNFFRINISQSIFSSLGSQTGIVSER